VTLIVSAQEVARWEKNQGGTKLIKPDDSENCNRGESRSLCNLRTTERKRC
jgi:hypothetical protein